MEESIKMHLDHGGAAYHGSAGSLQSLPAIDNTNSRSPLSPPSSKAPPRVPLGKYNVNQLNTMDEQTGKGRGIKSGPLRIDRAMRMNRPNQTLLQAKPYLSYLKRDTSDHKSPSLSVATAKKTSKESLSDVDKSTSPKTLQLHYCTIQLPILRHPKSCQDTAVPDLDEEGTRQLVETWTQVAQLKLRVMSAPASLSSQISGTRYESAIFKHRGIKLHHGMLLAYEEETSVLLNPDDFIHLVRPDEDEDNPSLDISDTIKWLLVTVQPEAQWEQDLINRHIFPQTTKFPSPSSIGSAVRFVQHTMSPVVVRAGRPTYYSYPPILTEDVKYRPSLGPVPQSKIPWYEPVDRLGQMRPDTWYAVVDPAFWKSVGRKIARKTLREALPGYLMLSDSDEMLPYMINESKKQDGEMEYAASYITFICVTILQSRLKLRAMAGLEINYPCPELTMWCFATAGEDIQYMRVRLREPEKNGQYVLFESEVRGTFNLTDVHHRNLLRQLQRSIHAEGLSFHLEAMKEEVKGAANSLSRDWRGLLHLKTAFFWVAGKEGQGEQKWSLSWKCVRSRMEDEIDKFAPEPGEVDSSLEPKSVRRLPPSTSKSKLPTRYHQFQTPAAASTSTPTPPSITTTTPEAKIALLTFTTRYISSQAITATVSPTTTRTKKVAAAKAWRDAILSAADMQPWHAMVRGWTVAQISEQHAKYLEL